MSPTDAAQPDAHTRPVDAPLAAPELDLLRDWAVRTWQSMDAMTHPETGLPADNISADLDPHSRSGYTSPTNIGGLLWSTLTARELGVLSPAECHRRLQQLLVTVHGIDHHEPTGMLWNWYDERDAAVLTRLDNRPVHPFASSVDNAWLATALHLVAVAEPSLAELAGSITARMRWDVFHDPGCGPAGLIRNGFWLDAPPDRRFDVDDHSGQGLDLQYQVDHYDTIVSETRIVSYLGIAAGQIPRRQYFSAYRGYPPSYREVSPPVPGHYREYGGVSVFEGARRYRGMSIVPGWGGSMFEELMPNLFVPEEHWAPLSWGGNHRLHVRAQREHGLFETGYGYWGFSPASLPPDGYREFGVDALGLSADGYRSDVAGSAVDGEHWGDGVVTPHAAFLALLHEPSAAFATLTDLARDFEMVGPGGFADAVAVRSGTVARRHLSLDQAMVLGACSVVLSAADGRPGLREWFCAAPGIDRIREVLAVEEFATQG